MLSVGQLFCGCISCSWYAWEVGRQRDPRLGVRVVLPAIPKKSDKVGFRAMSTHQSAASTVKSSTFVPCRLQSDVRENVMIQTSWANEPGRSTAGVTGSLRQVLSEAAEWGVGAFVASADVEGAFDCIRHEDVEKALLQKGVHPVAVCSVLRESCDLKGRIHLPGAPISPDFL